MDYKTAKEKAMEYGRKHGDKYDVSAETKDSYFFGMRNVPTDDKAHGVFVSKKTGRLLSRPPVDPKFIGKPKSVTADKKTKRK